MTKTSIDAKCEARTLSVARVRASNSKLALHHSPPAANQVDQEQDQRNHQQHVDDAAGHVERQAENPEQQQQDDERPEHGGYLLRVRSASDVPNDAPEAFPGWYRCDVADLTHWSIDANRSAHVGRRRRRKGSRARAA